MALCVAAAEVAARDYPVSTYYVHDSQGNIISAVQTREPNSSGDRDLGIAASLPRATDMRKIFHIHDDFGDPLDPFKGSPSMSGARGLTNGHFFRRDWRARRLSRARKPLPHQVALIKEAMRGTAGCSDFSSVRISCADARALGSDADAMSTPVQSR